MRTVSTLACLLAALALSSPAIAQPPDETQLDEARALADEGDELFAAGQYAEALVRFDKALAIIQVPKIGLYAARCADRLGHLVEAAERYLAAAKMPIPEQSREVHIEARAQAEAERADVLQRTPRLVIEVSGGDVDLVVTVDGKTVSPAAFGSYPVDPGAHHVTATSNAQQREEGVEVAERDVRRITLRFDGKASEPEPVAKPIPVTPPGGGDRADGSALPLVGWMSIGIGGGALVAGAVMGIVLLGKRSDLEGPCGEDLDQCAEDTDIDSYNDLRVPTTVLLAAGGGLVILGVSLVVADAVGDTSAALQVTPNGVALRGTF
jgi:hypothetical protein